MKKILIVNNNLATGGIQKSLLNLLHALNGEYEITLLLFSKSGAYLRDVPDGVTVITPAKRYRILGMTKKELAKYPFAFLLKCALSVWAKIFSRRSAMHLLGLFRQTIRGFDVAISYSHLPRRRRFENGCGDFVLDKTDCKTKICLIHCDPAVAEFEIAKNGSTYAKFDRIGCCSESVRKEFLSRSNIPAERVFTLRNFGDSRIPTLAEDNPFRYDGKYLNLISVARLSEEKGIDLAVDAVAATKRHDLRYYIIGDGPQKDKLMRQVRQYRAEDRIFLLGEKENPYRYLKNADYLLVPSRNEAAPMVFDEAAALGVRVLSSDTRSARELLPEDSVYRTADEAVRRLTELKKPEPLPYRPTDFEPQKTEFRRLIGADPKEE